MMLLENLPRNLGEPLISAKIAFQHTTIHSFQTQLMIFPNGIAGFRCEVHCSLNETEWVNDKSDQAKYIGEC